MVLGGVAVWSIVAAGDVGGAFEWALRATALLALGVGVVAYLKGAAREVTIKVLEESVRARDIKIGDVSADVTALHEKNRGLTEKVRVLEDIANSGEKIDALAEQTVAQITMVLEAVRGHHSEMLGVTTELHGDLGSMLRATEQLEAALGGLPLAIAAAIREGRK